MNDPIVDLLRTESLIHLNTNRPFSADLLSRAADKIEHLIGTLPKPAVIKSRLHEEDMAGAIAVEGFEHIKLPTLADEYLLDVRTAKYVIDQSAHAAHWERIAEDRLAAANMSLERARKAEDALRRLDAVTWHAKKISDIGYEHVTRLDLQQMIMAVKDWQIIENAVDALQAQSLA